MKRGGVVLFAPLAAGLLIVLLVVLVVSGHAPEFRGLVRFAPEGLVDVAPSAVTRVEVQEQTGEHRVPPQSSGWAVDGAAEAAPAELAAHIDAALRFLHVSNPARHIPAGELDPTRFAEFGLDPPASVVTLGTADRTIATGNFGILNPAGTSQYVRLAGAATVYLMARHSRRRMANRGRHGAAAGRTRGSEPRCEPVAAGLDGAGLGGRDRLRQAHRFERDGAGNWFRHTGQHSHAGSVNAHVADPAQARLIDAALEAFDETAVETRIAHGVDEQKLAQFGLTLPHLIVLLYARDSSTPLARLELGGSADSFDRYARLTPNGDVVTVAEFEVRRLTELLKAVGAGS